MGKKKKKYHNDYYDDYYDDDDMDYSGIHYDGDIRELLTVIADSIEGYMKIMETYAIFDGVTEKEWNEDNANLRKIIKGLRKGKTNMFDKERLNEILDSGHSVII